MKSIIKDTLEKTKDYVIDTYKHTSNHILMLTNTKNVFDKKSLKVNVKNIDCIDEYILLKEMYPNSKIGLLNLANAYNPGGSVLNMHRSQEEDICRRTSLLHSLHSINKCNCCNELYPIENNEIILSKDIYIIKNNKYKILDTPIKIDCVLTSAAIKRPKLKNGLYNFIDKNIMKSRIKLILDAAIMESLDVLVLGAYGCGVFKNPPNEVAQLFNEELTYCIKQFNHISFAILERNSEEPLNTIFKSVFQ